MRYGRTSVVDFLSRIGVSIAGFVATIVLTRTLGQEQYGTYVVVLAVLAWVSIAGNLGISQAIRKRVSETTDGNYVVAGAIAQFALFGVVATCLWLIHPYLNDFMGIAATGFILMMLAARLANGFVRTVLDGQHLVHVSSLLSPVERGFRSILQVILVIAGLGIAGALAGYVVAAILVVLIGMYFVSVPKNLPSTKEFYRLKSYAQFSWLSRIKGQTFLSMDTLILAVFVSNSLIAIYDVAWNLASLFAVFGESISRTLFPEMSKKASEGDSDDEIAGLLRVSLAYSGLFIIPGLLGAALVGDVVLTIYGPGFDSGYHILLILTVAQLLYGYMGQFLSTINAVDRPDLTFYINLVFITVNLTLNVFLISQYGWYGAAAATTTSAGVGLVLGYYYANRIIEITLPTREITRQWISAGVMAVVVLVSRFVLGDSLPLVVAFVGIGIAVYFLVLLTLSEEFRTTVEDNLPFGIPLVGSE